MGPIRCPETSVGNYHFSPFNNPEERSSHNLSYFDGCNRLHPLSSRNKLRFLFNKKNCCTEQSCSTRQEELVHRKILYIPAFKKQHPVASEYLAVKANRMEFVTNAAKYTHIHIISRCVL
jgi:hypothetical protein